MDSKKMPVKCNVTNCQYNESHQCYADSIEVNAMGDGSAKTSDGTACSTFKNSMEENSMY